MFKRAVKEFFLIFGIKLRKISIDSSPELRLQYLMNQFKIDTIYDIGANYGQFAIGMIKSGFSGRIISFEPISFVYDELRKNSSKHDNWFVAERCALGEKECITQINISDSSASSSILQMTSKHSDAAPYTKCSSMEEISIKRLDDVVKGMCQSESIFLKIDTQGFELPVLKGAEQVIQKTKILQLELSLVELYSGQELYQTVIDYLDKKGFELWFLDPAFIDPRNGRLLQMDALFINRNLI